jgi:hypothetical protein
VAAAAHGNTRGTGSDVRHRLPARDLFDDAAARATVRGTIRGALLVDGELQVNRLRRSEDTFVDVYMKYERSPQMDYYGLGADSRKGRPHPL